MRNADVFSLKSLCLCSLASALVASGCAEESSGNPGRLDFSITPESVISQGLVAGTGPGQVRDGWAVKFQHYVVSVGAVSISEATNPATVSSNPAVFLVDLAQTPSTGEVLWTFPEVPQGRWNIGFQTPVANASAKPHGAVPPAMTQQMVAQGWTYLVHGTMTHPNGISCPPRDLAKPPAGKASVSQTAAGTLCYAAPTLRFEIGAPAATKYGPCGLDGVPGVAVTAGQTTSAGLAMHGDHLFFNGFPEGSEGGVNRVAQWLADCDLNLDGVVTGDELKVIPMASLEALTAKVQLGGSPIKPLNTVFDYARAQFKTQGHFQGEGECAVDGVAHAGDHGHGHGHDH